MKKYFCTLLIFYVGILSASAYKKIEQDSFDESSSNHENIYHDSLLTKTDISTFKERLRHLTVESALLFAEENKNKYEAYNVFDCEFVSVKFFNTGSGLFTVQKNQKEFFIFNNLRITEYYFHDLKTLYSAIMGMIFAGEQPNIFSDEELNGKKLIIYKKIKAFYEAVNKKISKNLNLIEEVNILEQLCSDEE